MMKKCFVLLLLGALLMAAASGAAQETDYGLLLRYIPTEITVEDSRVTVDGCFVNMNDDCSVLDFEEITLSVWQDGEMIVSGDFGAIESLCVGPMGVERHVFTIDGPHRLNPGSYACPDHIYAVLDCTFSIESIK